MFEEITYTFNYRLCENGHMIYSGSGPLSDEFCQKCGASFVTMCSQCSTPMLSTFRPPVYFTSGEPVYPPSIPGACGKCGKVFPWTLKEATHSEMSDSEAVLIQPDYEWYRSISVEKSVPTRCQFANVHKCPRYYESLSLLGDAGITTSIAKEKDQELLGRWEKSEYWPVVKEHATSITGPSGQKTGFHNFCPEVSFDVYRLFASYLHRYSDDDDRDAVHAQLSKDQVRRPNDWRWDWATVTPLHYTDCPVYAMLSAHESKNEPPNSKDELFQLKPNFYGFSMDLKTLWRKVSKWRRSFRR